MPDSTSHKDGESLLRKTNVILCGIIITELVMIMVLLVLANTTVMVYN